LFSDNGQKKKFLVINTTSNPENLISMTSVLKAMYKREDSAEIVCLVQDSFSNLLSGLDFVRDCKGIRYAKIIKQQLAEKNINLIDLSSLWENYSVSLFPNQDLDTKQLYCTKLGLKCDNRNRIAFTKDEIKNANEVVKGDGLKIFVATSGTEENIYEFPKWSKLIEYLNELENTTIYTDLVKRPFVVDIDGVVFLGGNKRIKEQLAVAKQCDILITADNIFLMLADKFNVYTIGLAAGSDLKDKYDFDNFSVITGDNNSFPCWPCNRVAGIQCLKTGRTGKAVCIQSIPPAKIVSLVMKAIKEIGK